MRYVVGTYIHIAYIYAIGMQILASLQPAKDAAEIMGTNIILKYKILFNLRMKVMSRHCNIDSVSQPRKNIEKYFK